MFTKQVQDSPVYQWFEERLEIQAIADDVSGKFVPPHVNIFYCLGGITLTCFLIQFATGFAMTFYYRPTVTEAFDFGVTGYSLPWDQMGYWAVKIVSGVPEAIPLVGSTIVELIRGGTSVGQSTLTRFYSLHTFVLPWLIAVFMLLHFLMIRKQGISGPL